MALKTFLRYFVLASLVLGGTKALAQAPGAVSADLVKAAFLYNFAGFVEWPEHAHAKDSLVIGVIGAEDVEAALRSTSGPRMLQNRNVTVRRIRNASEAADVHILFIGADENYRLRSILSAVERRPILTVTESTDGMEFGSIINFVTTNRVQFEISLKAAAVAGLQLNARLLSVAIHIRKGETLGERIYAQQAPASVVFAFAPTVFHLMDWAINRS